MRAFNFGEVNKPVCEFVNEYNATNRFKKAEFVVLFWKFTSLDGFIYQVEDVSWVNFYSSFEFARWVIFITT